MMGALAHDHPATEPQHDVSPDRLSAPCLCTAGDMGHFDARLDTWAHVRSPGCGSRVV